MVVFDSSILLLLIRPDVNTPIDPKTTVMTDKQALRRLVEYLGAGTSLSK